MRRIFELVTVCVIAGAPLFGAQPLGGLAVYGNVWTNQASLPSGTSVFPGDVVETDATGMAVLASAEAGRLELRASSRAVFSPGAMTLERGAAASDGMTVRLGGYEVRPRDSGSDNWFVVAERDGERVVTAYRGDVLIARAGESPVLVPAGSFALAAALPTPKEAADGDDDDDDDDKGAAAANKRTRRRTGRATASTAGAGWSIGSLGTAASVAVVTGATAAAATGLAVGLRDDSVSPSN